MRSVEEGFLLLSSHLGDPDRKVLSPAQLRTLSQRVRNGEWTGEDRDLTERDLIRLGYDRGTAGRIVGLLGDKEALDRYRMRAAVAGAIPVTRVSEGYPVILRHRLGLDAPGCLWVKGDKAILNTPAVALVGSRELREENRAFAQAVGYQAAEQGLTLVSGNARGADRAAQEACLRAGGRVISIVADELSTKTERRNVLYVSEEDFDAPFTAQRALSRNRCIHALGRMVFVAQAQLHKGGTWDGTVKNLRFGWSNVACFRDGSQAAKELEQMGAYLVGKEDLEDLGALIGEPTGFFS